jgi:hypothetical protein
MTTGNPELIRVYDLVRNADYVSTVDVWTAYIPDVCFWEGNCGLTYCMYHSSQQKGMQLKVGTTAITQRENQRIWSITLVCDYSSHRQWCHFLLCNCGKVQQLQSYGEYYHTVLLSLNIRTVGYKLLRRGAYRENKMSTLYQQCSVLYCSSNLPLQCFLMQQTMWQMIILLRRDVHCWMMVRYLGWTTKPLGCVLLRPSYVGPKVHSRIFVE